MISHPGRDSLTVSATLKTEPQLSMSLTNDVSSGISSSSCTSKYFVALNCRIEHNCLDSFRKILIG